MYLRLYEYQAAQTKHFRVIGFKGLRPLGIKEKGEARDSPFKLDESLCRTRRIIRDLVLCNRFEYFCTFTFADPQMRYDLDACRRALTKWFNNFRARVAPAFRYLVVPEQHKDGAWHFHGLVWGIPPNEFVVPAYIQVRDRETQKLKEVRNVNGYVRWERYSKRFGFFDCSRICHYEACAAYVSKYITKALSDMAKSKHLYFCSKGLERPDLVLDADGVPFPLEPEYEDDFCRIAWATSEQVVGRILPDWYGECCADLRDPVELPKDMTRGQLETYIFEPLRMEDVLAYQTTVAAARRELLGGDSM